MGKLSKILSSAGTPPLGTVGTRRGARRAALAAAFNCSVQLLGAAV
jgi:hypothetical protein